jgi:peptidoglycan/LPS O-acetylase OafA/YrhL
VTTRTSTAGRSGDATIVQAGEVRSRRVESLRAIAAIAVLVGHVFGTAHFYRPAETLGGSYLDRALFGGGYGVYLFFALSGYLLFWPFARRDFGGGDRIDLRRYARNRALRILPLYYVVVIVVLVVQEDGSTFDRWWKFLLFAENFSYDTVGKVHGVLWSLVVELHFYILLPFLAAGLAWLARGSRRAAGAILLALAAASFGVRYLTQDIDDTPSELWRLSLPATFFFFVSGMSLALLRLSWQERRPRWLRGPLSHSTTWLLAAVPLWLLVFDRYDRAGDLAAALASMLMVGACVLPLRGGSLVKALEWRPLAILGVASYSLYLWHPPVVRLLHESQSFPTLLAISVPVCFAAAIASYYVIEAPFLRLRRRWAKSTPTMVGDPAGASALATDPPAAG